MEDPLLERSWWYELKDRQSRAEQLTWCLSRGTVLCIEHSLWAL